ncbi:MAG: Error-prone repair protein ImuA [Mucilaginibacter sp.]|nr:Error-prone repair protein ImuA [Mucilaginibacter sp.]
MPDTKRDIISKLQKDILLWEGFKPPQPDNADTFGLGPVEAAFPNSVFPVGALHELLCSTPGQAAATAGFIAGILGTLMKQGGACLWIGSSGKLFPASLSAFSVEADRVIFIDLKKGKDILWVTEEALKCEGLAAVIAEVQDINLAQSRRLQLAVESSKVTGFILRTDLQKSKTNTSVARWRISSIPSETEGGLPGVGFPRWQVELLKVRNGNPGVWKMEWNGGRFVPVDEKVTAYETWGRRAV